MLKAAATALVLALAPLAAAAAPDAAQRAVCLDGPVEGVTGPQIVAACDAVIKAGASGGELGALLAHRGVGYGVSARPARALQDFDAALKLLPTSDAAWYGRGMSLLLLGLHTQALEAFSHTIDLNAQDGLAYIGRAAAKLTLGRNAEALADYGQGALLAPDQLPTYLGRAYLYASTGRYELAIADYERALRVKPDEPHAIEGRDAAKKALADWQARLAAPGAGTPLASNLPGVVPARPVGLTHDCSELYPAISNAVDESGIVQLRYDVEPDGKIDNVVVAHSSGAPRLDEVAVACVANLWRSTPATVNHVAVPSPGHAVNIDFTTHGSEPATAAQFDIRGTAFLALGDYGKAVTAFTQSVALDGKTADYVYHRGIAYYAGGQMERAAADFALAQALKPDMTNAADARDLARSGAGGGDRSAGAHHRHGG